MDYVIGIVVVIAIAVVIFLICREIVCWYWKINEIVRNQSESNQLLKQILQELQKQNASTTNTTQQGPVN